MTAILTIIAILLPVHLAHAQSSSGVEMSESGAFIDTLASEDAGERAAELVLELNTRVDRIETVRARLQAASGEDSLVLRLQMFELSRDALDELEELAGILEAAEEKAPSPELRERVVDAFGRVTPRIWISVDRLREEIDEVRARRPSTEPAGLMALEDHVELLTGRLDETYGYSLRHVEALARLGIDSTEAKARLQHALADRADELSGRISLALVRIDELNARPEDARDETFSQLLVAAHRNLDINTASLDVSLDAMEELGLRTTEHRAKLVSATRDLTSTLTDANVALTLIGDARDAAKEWLAENGIDLLIKTLVFLVILTGAHFLGRIVRKALGIALNRSKLHVTTLLRRMLLGTAYNLMLALGALVALAQLGISLTPLLAGVGVIGFILGFALQDSLGNFASGLMILMYRPYDVGDIVDAGGAFGKVEAMSLVSTTILTYDNQTIVVPNNKIWGDVIKNLTHQELRRVDMTFGISYSDDIPKAERVLAEICEAEELILDDPPPQIRLNNLGESSVDFVVRPWVKVDDYWTVYWNVTREVKMRFDAEGISIPFPQRDVHLFKSTPDA